MHGLIATPAIDLPARLAAALGHAPPPRLAVAVSGGPDSVALLHLAVAAWPGQVSALTVDHGLRAAAAEEARRLGDGCAAAGIPHVLLAWAGPKPATGVQAAARAARYRLMGEWCAAAGVGVLMTAHHADDQAETLLMRLARGAGSGGLAGIRRCRPLAPGVMLARPLLDVRREALAAVAAASGWPIVSDPANRDPRHRRSSARATLAATPWLDAAGMALAAANLADDAAALDWTAAQAWDGRAQVMAAGVTLDAAGLPAALVQRLVARAVAEIAPDAAPRGPDLARLAARLATGGSATLAGVRARALSSGDWYFTKAPPRRDLRDKTS